MRTVKTKIDCGKNTCCECLHKTYDRAFDATKCSCELYNTPLKMITNTFDAIRCQECLDSELDIEDKNYDHG